MSGFWRRFDLGELAGVAEGPAVGLVEVARDLEAYAEIGWGSPTLSFEDRVMAAIAAEPPPRLRTELGPIATLREAWRLAWSGGRPFAVRAQALALVVTAAVALGAVGSFGLVAASRLFAPEPPTPIVQQSPVPTPSPSPTPTESPDASPSPRVSPDPASKQTPQPPPKETETPVGTDDHSGSGGSGGNDGGSGGSSGGEDDGASGEPGGGEDSGAGSSTPEHSGSPETPEPTA
jgi:uncharacterized membrane protein YgcG